MSLDTVVTALDGTGFVLRWLRRPTTRARRRPTTPARRWPRPSTAQAVPRRRDRVRRPPETWAPTDLVARVRGNSRRFPAHREVGAVSNPPLWWWMHEFFSGPTEEPKWYAPSATWTSPADC